VLTLECICSPFSKVVALKDLQIKFSRLGCVLEAYSLTEEEDEVKTFPAFGRGGSLKIRLGGGGGCGHGHGGG
jgi:hypothetical protein